MNAAGAHVSLINGFAGTGKTTIAYTVAQQCKARGMLGASFFCSRKDPDCSNPKLVFSSIADQLGRFHPPFGHIVAQALNKDPDLKNSSVTDQLQDLLAKPLEELQGQFPLSVIIIDALDQFMDEGEEHNATSIVLSSLATHLDKLLPLKFLITSRPEAKMFRALRRFSKAPHSFVLHEVNQEIVERDIEHYLVTRFIEVKGDFQLDDKWPAKEDVRALTQLSAGLFVFAVTAMNFIQSRSHNDPLDQLTCLLKNKIMGGSSPYRYLDHLYMQVLTDAFHGSSPELSSRFKLIMGTIVLLQYPLFLDDIERLLRIEQGTIYNTVAHLGSVLVVPRGLKQNIHFIHPSFTDFLTNATRCSDPRFMVNLETHHGLLAQACLRVMELEREIQDLSERAVQQIPPHLRYAYRHWVHHTSRSEPPEALLELLRKFPLGSSNYSCSCREDGAMKLSPRHCIGV